jgi:hypothetical protein
MELNVTAGDLPPTMFGFSEKDSGGNSVSSGVYFYRLHAGGQVLTRKMVLIR